MEVSTGAGASLSSNLCAASTGTRQHQAGWCARRLQHQRHLVAKTQADPASALLHTSHRCARRGWVYRVCRA